MLKIIIADDHQVVRRGLTFTIDAEKDMRVVAEAQNGAGVLALIKKHKPDVVLMDLQMPVMDGYTATQRLRADRRFDAMPIIALTAHAMLEEVERCAALGMNDHVTKPINPEKLYSALARHLPKS
ncbi:MAG: response regulator [Burkholderiaceae bacterium]|nr:response regulator [Burkholderiaceae bacterium]